MNIDLPEEVIEFMRDLANEITGQDNRATASPYYYVVMGQQSYAAADGRGDEQGYYCSDRCKSYTREEVESQYADAKFENDWDDEEMSLEDYIEANYEEYTVGYHEKEENVFLTMRGYNRHMTLNGHNYRYSDKPVHSYIKHAFRNPEMEGLLMAIMAFKQG